MEFKITMDAHEATDELGRLERAPDLKTIVAFNEIFASITAEVMALIHIETGSLKTTAKWDSPTYPTGWSGEIRVGGAAPGQVRNPAYYGVYELARGGSHFFFAPAYASVPNKMMEAMIKFYANSDVEFSEAATPSLSGSVKTAAKSVEKRATSYTKHKADTLKRRAKIKEARDITDPNLGK